MTKRAPNPVKIYQPPRSLPTGALANSLFIAGGITGAQDWQAQFARDLSDTELALLNPRRDHYNSLDPHALREQIQWEHDGLRASSAISFWFPARAMCLISLYELGSWAHWRDPNGAVKPLFVAVHPDYMRRENIEIQLELERPDVQIVSSLDDLTAQILQWQSSRA